MKKHVLERLADTHPEAEVWWDSSPLVYAKWANETADSFGDQKNEVKDMLARMYDPEKGGERFYRGVTTNPPLSLQAIEAQPERWNTIVDGIIKENPGIDAEALFWKTYLTIVRDGAAMFREVWEASGGKQGYLSGQVDPRSAFDYSAMFEQAMEIREQGPNVMVKVPGTKEGYQLLRELTARGIPTNNTLSFTLPQLVCAAKMAMEGLEIAKKNNVDTSKWRAVITHMTARYGQLGDFEKEAAERGITLTEEDIRWAEIAIYKKAYKIIEERGYKSEMLMCSMRVSPEIDGKKRCWHLEKVAGSNSVYTCPPTFIAGVMKDCDHLEFDADEIHREIPQDTMDKLMELPYFAKAYDENGQAPEEFNDHTALRTTHEQFSKATQKMVDFCKARM